MKNQSRNSEGRVKSLPPAGRLRLLEHWLAAESASRLFDRLHAEIDWQARTIRMFGRVVEQPRRIAFQGDAGVVYRYSGDDYHARPWHPSVETLRDRLAEEFGTVFNSVLINLYRDGADSMGWHADDEPELGRNPVVASISLGEVRRFVLRRNDERSRRVELTPAHGSLLLMDGDVQHAWQHQVPRTAKPVGPRINLTFRSILRPRRRPG